MVDLTSEEHRLALSIDAMDKLRALAVSEGDILRTAQIDAWFKEHAAAVRRVRDKIEADEFDNPR